MPALADPPTGTVTFLFTDIEGSTRLWEQHPDQMRPALARHDDLLRHSIEAHSGYVFKTGGDSFCAAFPDARQALAAALAAQTALAAEAWEAEKWRLSAPIRVRMALHTGSAEERGGDYFGPPLNRAARLMAAGHGGQTLLSGAALAAVQDALPPQASLRDLGRHRLKDLGQPEHVHQVIPPALPAEFPPLRSLGNPSLPNNLPQQTTSFIGREQEVGTVKALLLQSRLLTLTGAGGSGKTRLSLQVAADLLNGDGDGVWLVELGALFDPALVPQAVADVLGIKEQPDRPLRQTLLEALQEKRLLLILDNCEHLVSACAELADALLRSCPGVHLLTSSREALNVPDEQVYRVPTLSVPDPKQAYTPPALLPFEAVRLFTERAKTVQPSFSVTEANAADVAAICVRLDGIPLAIELAAARVRSLSVEEVNRRLGQRFRLLTGGSRTVLPRQQTLRATVDWSYDLLTQSEKTLLCRLSVFAGGWILEAAEAVCSGGDIEAWEVLDLLTSLVNKSLVAYDETEDGAGRARLLETVRHYAADLLAASGEAEAVQDRHLSWYVALAEEAEPELQGTKQAEWLNRLEAEHDNMRAGLMWSAASSRGADWGLRLAAAQARFWQMRGYWAEARVHLAAALARAGLEGGAREQAKVLASLGLVAQHQGDLETAGSLGEQALAVFRETRDRKREARCLTNLAGVAWMQGDMTAVRIYLEQALAIFREIEARDGEASCLMHLGSVAYTQGDVEMARLLSEQALAMFRESGNKSGEADCLSKLSGITQAQGDLVAARLLNEQALAMFRESGDRGNEAICLMNLGEAAFSQGDLDAVSSLAAEALAILRDIGYPDAEASCINLLACVARKQGDLVRARTLFTECLTLKRQLGNAVSTLITLEEWSALAMAECNALSAARLMGAGQAERERRATPMPHEQKETHEWTVTATREALGPDSFAAEWDIGRAMTLDQAVEYALSAEGSDLKPL